jgi:hypothetical protein
MPAPLSRFGWFGVATTAIRTSPLDVQKNPTDVGMYTESVPHYGYGARSTQPDLPPFKNAIKANTHKGQ